MTERKIIFEKWVDPYGADNEDMAWPGAFGTMESDNKNDDNDSNLFDDNEDFLEEDENVDLMKMMKQTKPMQHLITPMGLIPITEWSSPGSLFNLWTAHTNFRMTKNIKRIVNATEGIETLDVFTPYRWRFAIGKAFDSVEVKQTLLKNLQCVPPDPREV